MVRALSRWTTRLGAAGRFLLLTASIGVAAGCGFDHKTSTLVPTSLNNTGATSASTFSYVGRWAPQSVSLPAPNTCSNFQWQVTNQTASVISGQFSVQCAGDISLSGTVTGQLGSLTIPLTASGTGSLPGIAVCPFSLTGTGTLGVPDASSLQIQYSGTSCIGPLAGTEVLHHNSAAPAPGPTTPAAPTPAPSVNVFFDHPWSGNVELALRSLLASGLAGPDGSNGQAVINQLNAMGGIYAGGEFQPRHDGVGDPTYGFGWFYVTYVNDPMGMAQAGATQPFYQIVEFGAPPPGD